jgi:hypothetical protein
MVSRRATFELRGFRVTGGLFGVLCGEMRPDRFGVTRLYIDSHCQVIGGGGTVASSEAHGITRNDLTIADVTVENVGQEGIYAGRKGKITNVTITGSGATGVRIDGAAKIADTHISGSGEDGIDAFRTLRLSDSIVLGNGVGPNCPYPFSCVDVRTPFPPRVVETQCGTSGGAGLSHNRDWNVCTSD